MANKTLFSAFRQISGLTAVSRMLGFIRDVVFAHYLVLAPQPMRFWLHLSCQTCFGG